MTHDPLVDTARRHIASLGNIEHAAPREPAAAPAGAAFPHLGGWPHTAANPAPRLEVADGRARAS